MNDTFHVYITLLTSAYLNNIMGGIIRLGYEVGPLASDGQLICNPKDLVSSCVALHIRSTKKIIAPVLLGHLKKSLDDISAKYYNIVVTSSCSDATWSGSNILSDDLKKKPKPLRHNHLKLVKLTEEVTEVKSEDLEE